MARWYATDAGKKKTAGKKTAGKKRMTRIAKHGKKKTAGKKRMTRVAKHGKTAAARRKYIGYLDAKKKLIKEYFG